MFKKEKEKFVIVGKKDALFEILYKIVFWQDKTVLLEFCKLLNLTICEKKKTIKFNNYNNNINKSNFEKITKNGDEFSFGNETQEENELYDFLFEVVKFTNKVDANQFKNFYYLAIQKLPNYVCKLKYVFLATYTNQGDVKLLEDLQNGLENNKKLWLNLI